MLRQNKRSDDFKMRPGKNEYTKLDRLKKLKEFRREKEPKRRLR